MIVTELCRGFRFIEEKLSNIWTSAGMVMNRSEARFLAVLLFASVLVLPAAIWAQVGILEMTGVPQTYMLRLAGTVLNESFDNVQAVLKIDMPSPESVNDYFLTIIGHPTINATNSFYWISEGTEMICCEDEITCRIKGVYAKPLYNHFFYLSPILLKVPMTQHEKEDKQKAKQTARPTLVSGQAGELKLRFYSNEVTGWIWMKGYDNLQHTYVGYQARIWGRKIPNELKWRKQFTK